MEKENSNDSPKVRKRYSHETSTQRKYERYLPIIRQAIVEGWTLATLADAMNRSVASATKYRRMVLANEPLLVCESETSEEKERVARARVLFESGLPITQAAKACGVSYDKVRRSREAEGWKSRSRWDRAEGDLPMSDRDRRIVENRKNGLSLRAIAEQEGVSTERIRQIVALRSPDIVIVREPVTHAGVCSNCGVEFRQRASVPRRFCSNACRSAHEGGRYLRRDHAERLMEKMDMGHTLSEALSEVFPDRNMGSVRSSLYRDRDRVFSSSEVRKYFRIKTEEEHDNN